MDNSSIPDLSIETPIMPSSSPFPSLYRDYSVFRDFTVWSLRCCKVHNNTPEYTRSMVRTVFRVRRRTVDTKVSRVRSSSFSFILISLSCSVSQSLNAYLKKLEERERFESNWKKKARFDVTSDRGSSCSRSGNRVELLLAAPLDCLRT